MTVNEEYIKYICEHIGYGALIQIAERLWIMKDPIGAIVTGPCRAFITACDCIDASMCDWCCGSGWLTHKVKKVKDNIDPGMDGKQ